MVSLTARQLHHRYPLDVWLGGAQSRSGHCEEKKVLDVRFEVFTAVTKKNAVFWDIETQMQASAPEVTAAETIRDYPQLLYAIWRNSISN
jgi:hypothetical protein